MAALTPITRHLLQVDRWSLVRSHWPALMLLLATVCWGAGFSWAKNVGDAVNRAAGQPNGAGVGPMVGLAIRFGTATLLWLVFVPTCRRGWTWQTLWRGVVIGLTLAAGLILQHLGLANADEATTAFLTNLTVVLVPLWQLAVMRQTPRRSVLVAIPLALLGMALLCGVGRPGPTSGAVYGVACAVAFAAEILLLDRLGQGQSPARIALLLFATSAVSAGVLAPLMPGFAAIDWQTLRTVSVAQDLVPAVLLTTLLAFALMTAYQPKVDATRAAMLYLAEPLFAAAYAWFYNGRRMSGAAMAGAALILLANGIAEWRGRRV